MPKLN